MGVIAIIICLVVAFFNSRRTVCHAVVELPTPSPAVRTLVNQDRIIEAIKLYRVETAASLRESKHVIDSLRS